MSAWRQLSRGLHRLLQRRAAERDTRDEVEHYFAEARAHGVPARELGDASRTREEVRSAGWEYEVETALADLRYAARQLRHNPAFSLTAVVVLALGIGVGTAMFSVLNAALMPSLPYAHPDQLVTIAEPRGQNQIFWSASHLDALDWRHANRSLQSLAWYTLGEHTLEGRTSTIEVNAFSASANLFSTLGLTPQFGRGFSAQDVRGHAAVAVISHSLWRKWFQGAAGLGQSLNLGGKPYTVVGILPAGAHFPFNDPADVWTPYQAPTPDKRGENGLLVIARLRPGVGVQTAQAGLSAIQARIAGQYGNLHLPDRVAVTKYTDTLVGGLRGGLEALALAVGMVWLIACASVAGLMLTRLAARRRELGVRAALGAGRLRLARQLLSESLLLGLMAAAGGWAVAALVLAGLRPFLSHNLPSPVQVGLSPLVLGLLLGASLLSVALIGLVPALGASRISAAEGLQDRSAGTSRGQARLRHGLVVGEIALALVLLAGAGLLLRTLYALKQVPLGFATANIVTTRLNIPRDRFVTRSIHTYLEQPLLQRLNALPGVAAAAVTSVAPLAQGVSIYGRFLINGQPHADPSKAPEGAMRFTSPGFAKVFGIPMERGRFFNAALDTPTSQPVVVINHALAAKYFHGKNPIGQQIATGKATHAVIIGVLADVHSQAVNLPPGPVIHFSTTQLSPTGGAPFYNIGSQFVQLAVRGNVPAATLEPEIRSALHAVAPQVAAGDFTTMNALVAQSLGDQTFAARLLTLFGIAALLIALAGLYGLLAYAVAQRKRELGIRLALGASRGQIVGLVLGKAAWLVGAGVAIGLALALGFAHVLGSYVYGVAPRDPLTLAAAAALLALCGLAAAWLPARRAAAVAVVEALRGD